MSIHILTEAATFAPMASDGLIGLAGEKVRDFGDFLKLLVGVVAPTFIVYKAIQARAATATIVISGITAALFMWFVFNVDTVRGWFDGEFNAAPAVTITPDTTADTTTSDNVRSELVWFVTSGIDRDAAGT